jgi:hypothetical protein
MLTRTEIEQMTAAELRALVAALYEALKEAHRDGVVIAAEVAALNAELTAFLARAPR